MRRSTLVVVTLLALAVLLVGCIGQETSLQEAEDDRPEDGLNPWQAGLDDAYPTPDVAKERSAEEREAHLAPPGDPEFAAFDATMEAWMETNDIPTGQLAIIKDGQLRYTNAYGHTDRGQNDPADQDTMFRLASVTKPMTAALVTLQIEQGLYNETDPVFCIPPDPAPDCLLPIDPHPARPIEDERVADVEVRHLIDHEAGWGGQPTWMLWGPDPGPIDIADELDIDPPPPAWRTAQYLMGESLADDPGETFRYCNICYMLAGLVAEAATGAKLPALYDAYLFEPLEVDGDIEQGYTVPEDRNPREPFYACDHFWGTDQPRSVYNPNETVCWPDGGFSLEGAGLAAAGLVSTASAVAAVYETVIDHAIPYDTMGPIEWKGHRGGLPGTAALSSSVEDEGSLTGEIQYVALFNTWGDHGDACSPLTGQGIPLSFCSYDDLDHALMRLSTTWGSQDSATPSDGTD